MTRCTGSLRNLAQKQLKIAHRTATQRTLPINKNASQLALDTNGRKCMHVATNKCSYIVNRGYCEHFALGLLCSRRNCRWILLLLAIDVGFMVIASGIRNLLGLL